ncbi:MAG: hypothetical protein IJH71_02915 [Eubacterium sp.]|nr:hypothetical protein [Eubacterium sp.]
MKKRSKLLIFISFILLLTAGALIACTILYLLNKLPISDQYQAFVERYGTVLFVFIFILSVYRLITAVMGLIAKRIKVLMLMSMIDMLICFAITQVFGMGFSGIFLMVFPVLFAFGAFLSDDVKDPEPVPHPKNPTPMMKDRNKSKKAKNPNGSGKPKAPAKPKKPVEKPAVEVIPTEAEDPLQAATEMESEIIVEPSVEGPEAEDLPYWDSPSDPEA